MYFNESESIEKGAVTVRFHFYSVVFRGLMIYRGLDLYFLFPEIVESFLDVTKKSYECVVL